MVSVLCTERKCITSLNSRGVYQSLCVRLVVIHTAADI